MSCNGNENYARQLQAEEVRIASNENLTRKISRESGFDPNFNTNGDAKLAKRLSYANSKVDFENILSEHDYVRSAILDPQPLSPVHLSQRPLPSVPTGPSTISPSKPKIWDSPARPENGNKKVETKKTEGDSNVLKLLNALNDNLIFFVIGLIIFYLVYGTNFLLGSKKKNFNLKFK